MDQFQPPNLQEIKLKNDIKQKGAELNQYFRSINLKIKTQQNKSIPSYNFNSRGDLLLTNEQIHQNYKKQFFLWKWKSLPICKRNIQKKMYFWGVSSLILAHLYGLFKKTNSNGAITKLPIKFYIKSYFAITFITFGFTILESLLFDQYCDINSIHYQTELSRLNLAKKIRKELQQ